MNYRILLIFIGIYMGQSFPTMGQDIQNISMEDGNGKELTYSELLPVSGLIEGVLVLMPGFGQQAGDVFEDTDLPRIASDNGLLVVSIPTGFNLSADKFMSDRITSILTDVLIRHAMDQEPFVFGGFSGGGTILLRYAERCHENPGDHPVVPSAVFTVDSPVDLIAFWDYIDREQRRGYSEVGINEAKSIAGLFENRYGSLEEHREVYEDLTPFDAGSPDPGNEVFLERIPVRVYHDIDIPWLLAERRRSAYDANFLISSEMISRLMLMGNMRAEFVQSPIEGRRKDGRRHPHSWNIVDSEECVQWMQKAMLLDQD